MAEKLSKIYGNTEVGGVGTLLDPSDTSFSNLLFNKGSYVLGRDLTFISQLENVQRAAVLRTLFTAGVLDKNITYVTEEDNPDWGKVSFGGLLDNQFTIGKFRALLNGYLITVAGANNEEGTGNLITLPAPPTGSTRYDLVFLEAWFAEVSTGTVETAIDDNVFRFGGVESGTIANALKDSAVGVETARAVQLRWRIRTFEDVAVGTEDVEYTGLYAWGANDEDTTLLFVKDDYSGMSVAGSGSSADAIALGSVDGFCYAIPLFRMVRASADATITDADVHADLRAEVYLRVKAAGVIS